MGRKSARRRGRADATSTPSVEWPSTWLPLSGRRALVVAVGVAALVLLIDVRTLAPTVTLVDSGELILAAWSRGIAHPPGTPLWVMLAHMASRIPIGSVAVRVNGVSAVCAALAAGAVVLAMRELLLGLRPGVMHGRDGEAIRRDAVTAAVGAGPAWLGHVVPAVVGLVFGVSRTLWSYATVTEVYTLNILLLAVLLFLVLRWRRVGQGDRPLRWAAFLFGLALGVHHVTVALALPALATVILAKTGSSFLKSRGCAVLALFALAGLLLVYSYLPLAASRKPVLNWGNPVTPSKVLWHITGRQYQSYFVTSNDAFRREASRFGRYLFRQYGPAWFPAIPLLASVGAVWLYRRDRKLLGALGILLGANLLFGLSYEIAEDKDAYYLPSFLACVLAAGCGAHALLDRARRRPGLAVAALALVPLTTLIGNYRYSDRSRFTIGPDYVHNVLREVRPGGLLLTEDWQVYSPMLYLREVEGLRQDVVVIDLQLLRRSWYFHFLNGRFPQTMRAVEEQTRTFLEDLLAWEHDPGLYARDASLNRRIDERFLALIRAFATTHGGPVYATRDTVLPPLNPDPAIARTLTADRSLVPRGLVFELVEDASFHALDPLQLETRGLFDGSIPFEPDDVVSLKVRPAYLGMIAARGMYLASHGYYPAAIGAFDQALGLDPGFTPAFDGRMRARAAMEKAARPPANQ